MNAPTKAEVDNALASICREQQEFRSCGNHNRAIAREHIRRRNARKLDEIQSANHAQLQTAVKGGDQYDYHYPSLVNRVLRWMKKWSDRT